MNEAIAAVPKKVQDALNNGTVIDVGKNGASQYDYIHDILYVAKGAEKRDVIHEIGHMVEIMDYSSKDEFNGILKEIYDVYKEMVE